MVLSVWHSVTWRCRCPAWSWHGGIQASLEHTVLSVSLFQSLGLSTERPPRTSDSPPQHQELKSRITSCNSRVRKKPQSSHDWGWDESNQTFQHLMLRSTTKEACWRFGLAQAGKILLDSELEPDSSDKSHLVTTVPQSGEAWAPSSYTWIQGYWTQSLQQPLSQQVWWENAALKLVGSKSWNLRSSQVEVQF